ncbi:MAG TPA: 2-phospho-L-lactate guanylyltransferase [Solirubrobacter sp.]|nr:2-phospho-L-lactate guanylyltransferase [Solirubrobacter sp.]
MRTFAILPVKSFGRAKQRLTGGYPDRPSLAAAMVADVIDALTAVSEIEEVIVVTAQAVSADTRVRIVPDPAETGQSPAALRGIAVALERGAERVLLVPGDCPTLDPAEVRSLLTRAEPVVIVPDRHGTGTNALLLTPPDVMPPAFGEGSCARHRGLGEDAGVAVGLASVPSLGLDVDTPDDLAALRRALAARPGGAARTRALLGEAAVA